MIEEAEIREETKIPLNDISLSFRASAGNPTSHALFARGYALSHGIKVDNICRIFRNSFNSLTDDELSRLYIEMGLAHSGNSTAQKSVSHVRREYKFNINKRADIIRDQLPRQTFMDSLQEEIEAKGIDVEDFDIVLQKIFEEAKDSQEIIQDVMNISAYLGLNEYDDEETQLRWWEELGNDQKQRMINAGKKLIEGDSDKYEG